MLAHERACCDGDKREKCVRERERERKREIVELVRIFLQARVYRLVTARKSHLRGAKKRIACSLEVYSADASADGCVGKRANLRLTSITGLFTEDAYQQSYATLKFSWQLLEPRRHHDPRVCERCRAVLLQGA